jgi:hypothetical protein
MITFKRKNIIAEERLQEAGLYEAEILGAFDVGEGKAINFKLKIDGKYTDYIRLTLKKKNGEDNNYALNQLNEFMILLDIDELELMERRNLALENRKIGILVDIVENEGYKNLQLISWCDIETQQTAYEFQNDLEATQIEKLYAKLEQKYA